MIKRTILIFLLVLCMLPINALAASNSSSCKTYDCSSGVCKKNTKCASRCTGSQCSQAGTSSNVSGSSISSMSSEVIRQTNADRAKNGLGQLRQDADLTAAACVRAKEIVSQFSHTRPNGQRGLTVSSKAKGENIAEGQQSANKVMAAWMSSSGHRTNILRASYKSIGVCAYQVNGIMYWVQLFGN